MNRLNFFGRSKKEKDFSKSYENILNEKNLQQHKEVIDIEDLKFFQTSRRNNETAEDAVSIRSVDCKSKMKWSKNGLKKVSNQTNITKSFNIRDQATSYRNLNIISEIGESPAKGKMCNYQFSKSMILCSPNNNLENLNWKNQFKRDFYVYENSVNNPYNIISEEINSPQSLSPCPLTTGGITSRHNSNSSTHPSMKKPWIETEDGRKAQDFLSKDEIDRQNIIHELLTGEIDSLNDLKGVVKNYKQPLETLKLISSSESFNIFYKIENIIPLYEDLINMLEKSKDDLKVIKSVGKSLLKWSESLEPIVNYCTHLYYSKNLLEEKRKEKDFAEFLQRCSVSKFSRKLDLWAFIDNPRSRLMKYPLLIERIIKSTHSLHHDLNNLLLSLERFEEVLSHLDKKTGEEMCKFYLEKLEFVEQNQFIQLVKSQKVLLLEGKMKIGRSIHFQKIHSFLFNDVLVFTKHVVEEKIENNKYVVYGNPLPTSRLVLENINDGEIKMGSFRSTFSSDNGSKNVFRLTLLSNFIPECEFDDNKEYQVYNSLTILSDRISPVDKSENSYRDCRLLKNSQTILQVSTSEEKQLWLNSLRRLVVREIKREDLFSVK